MPAARPFPKLLTVAEAAKALGGVPESGLRAAAKRHKLLVKIGRAVRISEDDLGELIRKCRDHPKAQDSSGGTGKAGNQHGLSEKVSSSVAQAQQTADKLKSLSRTTSPREGAKVVPLSRET